MEVSLCSCDEFVSAPCMEHAKKIDNWQLTWMPGKKGHCLTGTVDGKKHTSPRIIQSSGLFTLTEKGCWYMMLNPIGSWLKWLKKIKHEYDIQDPLKIKGKQ